MEYAKINALEEMALTMRPSHHADNDDDSNSTQLRLYDHPTLHDYYTHLTPFITLCIFIATLLTMLNVAIFRTTVVKLKKRLNPPLRRLSIGMCSLYPIICAAALCTILLPKAWLVCHTVMHVSFTVGAVIFHRLCFSYVGSELNYLKETDGRGVAINTPPCCCCCLCLPSLMPSKVKFCVLRYLIWQMPFVQASIMMVLNVIYYREKELYSNVMVYFMPFIVCSIIAGIWGLNITVRMVNSVHAEYGLMKKMFCLQLILLLCKLQYLILDSQMNAFDFGGPYPINHTIYKQTIINVLILTEMVLVSMLAQNAYKVPVQIIQS